MDFPQGTSFYKRTLCNVSLPFAGFAPMIRGNVASTAWPAANRAIYMPFSLVAPFELKTFFWANGATITGTVHVDIGVFQTNPSAGTATKICSTGAVVQSGTSAIQSSTLGTEVFLVPGSYALAMAHDSTQTFMSFGPVARLLTTVGIAQQASAYTLPATATFASPASAFIPLCGMSNADTI